MLHSQQISQSTKKIAMQRHFGANIFDLPAKLLDWKHWEAMRDHWRFITSSPGFLPFVWMYFGTIARVG